MSNIREKIESANNHSKLDHRDTYMSGKFADKINADVDRLEKLILTLAKETDDAINSLSHRS